jgi:hypothetical protein
VAVADAGATGNFMIPGAPVTNISPSTKTPIIINLPDGSQIKSTHTCEIDNPDLPKEARHAHIVPGLAHTSLVSIKMLCDAGCILTYDKNACKVYFKNKVMWRGVREPSTGLWILNITTPDNKTTVTDSQSHQRIAPTIHQGNNAYHMSSKNRNSFGISTNA